MRVWGRVEDNENFHSVLYIALGVLCELKVQAENLKISAMKSILLCHCSLVLRSSQEGGYLMYHLCCNI